MFFHYFLYVIQQVCFFICKCVLYNFQIFSLLFGKKFINFIVFRVYAYVFHVYVCYFFMFCMILIWYFRKNLDLYSKFYWDHHFLRYLGFFLCFHVHICHLFQDFNFLLHQIQFLENCLCFFIVLLCNQTSIILFTCFCMLFRYFRCCLVRISLL